MTFLTIVIPLDLLDLGMVSAQTRSAFVVRENRRPQGPSGLLGARRPWLFCRVSA